MDSRYKIFITGLIPFLTICGGLWNWGYWSTFDINIFVFIDVIDIIKSFIIPLLSSAIYFIVGQILSWFFFRDRLPYGGGAHTKTGTFLRKYSKLIVFIWLTLVVALLAFSYSPYRWTQAVWMLMPVLVIPIMETGLMQDMFPDNNNRIVVLSMIVIIPLLSFAQGKIQAEQIFRNEKFKTIDKETIRQVSQSDSLTYKFLGVGGDYIFGITKDNKSTILIQKEELKNIVIKE